MRFRLHFTFHDLIDSTVMKLTKQMTIYGKIFVRD